jgi:hypothetical protein
MRRKSHLFLAVLVAVALAKALGPALLAHDLATRHVADLALYFPQKLTQLRGVSAQLAPAAAERLG